MAKKRIVIVGGVAGGASAAARARRLSEDASIIMFERGPYVSFANCGLPYYVGGEIKERSKLLLQTPDSLHRRLNIDVRVLTEVTAIDRERRIVQARNLTSGEITEEEYDALVLATGARPIRPALPGIDRPGLFLVREVPDTDSIQEWLARKTCRTAVVVGGGFIGLEMAEQLVHRGLKVSVIEAAPQVLPPLDHEMAEIVHQELRSKGVDLYLSSPVERFEAPVSSEEALASVVITKGGINRLPADLIIFGVGVRPNADLARTAGLDLGPLGGVKVSETLQTSDPAIWAVGDCIEVQGSGLGTPALIALAGPANRQGRIAADNIFGGQEKYAGTLGTSIVRVFSLSAGSTGANERQLKAAGSSYEKIYLHPNSHAGYYPGAQPLAMKILFDRASGRLLGAQAVGADGVDKRIDILATALHGRMTVDDLAALELAYAPPFGSAKDPVNLAGMAAQNVVRGLVRLAHWHEVLPADGQIILDVREPHEVQKGAIPGALHIPLGEIRFRLNEIPKENEIVVYCQSGQRSYYACRTLMLNGYRCRNLSGAYKTWSQRAALHDKATHT